MYPHVTNGTIVCECEMMTVKYFFVKNYADCPFYYKVISIRNKVIQSMRKRDVK